MKKISLPFHSPAAFLLPGEYTKLVAEYTRILHHTRSQKGAENPQEEQDIQLNSGLPEANENAPLNVWICKPTGSSQGKGITIFKVVRMLYIILF